jgi:ATP-dependent RNA helicase RhlE
MDLLFHILQSKELDCVLVFSRTKHGADKISNRLERSGVKAVAIHSNRTQAQRQRALAGFKQGQFKVMVATDIAARGIDVEGISHVVNFDTPTFAEDYIHRIGRTGRASATGDAITFVSNQELKYLKSIERYTDKRFELKRYPGFDYTKKTPSPEKQSESKSSEDRRDRGHGRRDERHDRRRTDSGRPQREQRRTETSGKPYHEQGRKDSSEKPHSEQRHTESSGKPYRDQRHKGYSEKSHDEQRRKDSSGKSRREFSSHDGRNDTTRRTSQGTGRSQFVKKQPPVQSIPPSQETDWRKLVSEIEEGGSFKKKLKKLFIREKV